MRLQILDNDGKVKSESQLFDDPLPPPDPRMPEAVREARFYSMRSAIVPRPGGGFLVAAAKYEIGRSAVWVQRASADGSPDGAPIRITEMRDARGASVRLVPLREATVLLWISPDEVGDRERLFACAIDPDGRPVDEIHELLPALHHDSIALANPEFDVAATSDHTFALVWAEDGRRSVDIIEQEFSVGGMPSNRRMQIAGGGSTAASKPLLLPVSSGLAVVWRETAGRATNLRGATLGHDRRLSEIVDVATERFADVGLAGSGDNLLLATLEADRAGVALKVRHLATDLCPLGEPGIEAAGAIDTGSMRITGSSSSAALVWSQREESEHTRVSLGVLRASQ